MTKPPKVAQLRRFLSFIEERERIRLKRAAGDPWPWTKDPVLQRFRFCCVDREDDKVTKWIRENWREPYKDHPNLWFAMAVARQINLPSTLAEIGFPEVWNPRKVLRILEKRKARGETIFSGAYILGGGNPGGVSKIRYTVMDILNPLYRKGFLLGVTEDYPFPGCSLQEAHTWFLEQWGFGKFLAYEVVTDLRHTRYLYNAKDIMTWANIGPGAQRGLNRLYERELRKSHPQSQLLEELLRVQDWVIKNRDEKILPHIESRTIEHQLCEIDKYFRAQERLREGRIVGLERFKPPGLI